MDSAQAIPILPSPDISLTKEFYRTELGFDVIQPEMDQYVMMRRGTIELHFWLSLDKALPEVSSCYIRGGEIAALHAEFSARGVPGLSAFEKRPWNMKEFYLHDPHGNLLRFGCSPDET